MLDNPKQVGYSFFVMQNVNTRETFQKPAECSAQTSDGSPSDVRITAAHGAGFSISPAVRPTPAVFPTQSGAGRRSASEIASSTEGQRQT